MSFQRILVATDFGDCSRQALDLAVNLAPFGAQLTLLHVWDAPRYSYGNGLYLPAELVAPVEQAAIARLEQELTELKKRYPTAKSALRAGAAWEQVLGAANDLRADLIVMGTHGRRGLEHALLGSVAEKVVRSARVPVLTVHARAE